MTTDNTSVDELREILKDFDRVRSGDNSWIAMDRSVAKLRKFINSYTKQREQAAREPLERILQKAGYGKCLECKDYYHDDDMTYCEPCNNNGDESGMHDWCAGFRYAGDGEYPAESAYALCKKHSKARKEES